MSARSRLRPAHTAPLACNASAIEDVLCRGVPCGVKGDWMRPGMARQSQTAGATAN
jgi:hypothetical protein